jgi:hypothetical protein
MDDITPSDRDTPAKKRLVYDDDHTTVKSCGSRQLGVMEPDPAGTNHEAQSDSAPLSLRRTLAKPGLCHATPEQSVLPAQPWAAGVSSRPYVGSGNRRMIMLQQDTEDSASGRGCGSGPERQRSASACDQSSTAHAPSTALTYPYRNATAGASPPSPALSRATVAASDMPADLAQRWAQLSSELKGVNRNLLRVFWHPSWHGVH